MKSGGLSRFQRAGAGGLATGEGYPRDAVARRALRNVRVPGQQAQRAAILRQHVSPEMPDALPCSRLEDLLQKHRAEAEALPSVLHDETDVGGDGFLGKPVARHADQLEL